MRIEEVRKLTDQELVEKVYELKSDLMALRFQQKTGNLDNGKKITEGRKTLAIVLTGQEGRQVANKESQ